MSVDLPDSKRRDQVTPNTTIVRELNLLSLAFGLAYVCSRKPHKGEEYPSPKSGMVYPIIGLYLGASSARLTIHIKTPKDAPQDHYCAW